MAVQITSDSIIKILVRRGLESDRLQTVLTEGELGYSIDTRRLFVGDGITLGGSSAGNKYLGQTGDKNAYISYGSIGDTIYENNVLFAYSGQGAWEDIHPKFYVNPLNGQQTIEADPSENKVRISTEFPGQGFTLGYADAPTTDSIQGINGRLEFNSTYVSLCAASNSFYFGNIRNRTVKNNLNARVNIDSSLFINDPAVSPNQICINARPASNNATIESVSGNFDVQGKSTMNLFADKHKFLTGYSNYTTTFSSARTGIAGTPDFDFYGVPQFRDNALFSQDATIFGNLSVQGDLTYLNTIVTVTSTLSVVNYNSNVDTVVIQQLGGENNQTVLRIMGTSTVPYLLVKDGPVIAINCNPGTDTSAKLFMDGGALFYGSESFRVNNTASITLSSSGVTNLSGSVVNIGSSSNDVNIRGNTDLAGTLTTTGKITVAAGGLQVAGNITSDADIVAYYTSDERLKTNIKPITSALHKVAQLQGIEFDWNELSDKTGHEVGVLAQAVEKVLPEAVTTRENGYKAVKYEKLIPLLIEAIKELTHNK